MIISVVSEFTMDSQGLKNPKMDHPSGSDDEIETLLGQFKCKVCSNPYQSLIQHLNKKERCKRRYSVQELDHLKEQSRKRASLKNKLWKQENKDLRAGHNSTYYEKNRSVIAENRKIKYQINKEEENMNRLEKYHHQRKRQKVEMNAMKIGTILLRSILILKHYDLLDGAIYPCICCEQLNYEEGVIEAHDLEKHVEKETLERHTKESEEKKIFEKYWICHNCFWHLKYYKMRPTIFPISFAPLSIPKHRNYFRKRCPELAILFSMISLKNISKEALQSAKTSKLATIIDHRQFTDINEDYKTSSHGFLLTFGEWENPLEETNPFHPFKHCLCYLEITSHGKVNFVLAKTKPNHFDAAVWMQKKEDLSFLNIGEIQPALKLLECPNTDDEKLFLKQEGFDDLAFLYYDK